MTKKEEILAKIEKAKKNPHMSDNLRDQYIKGKEKELEALERETPAEVKKEEKAEEKKEEKKEPKSKKTRKKREKKKHEKKTIMFRGKEINEGDKEYCNALVAAWDERRANAKVAGKKYRTEPVIKKIAGDVTSAVVKAVNSVPVKDIKNNPTQFKKEVEALESAAKSFISAFKELLGSDYKKGEVDPEFKHLETLLDKLLKKYSGKSMEDGGGVPTAEEVKNEEKEIAQTEPQEEIPTSEEIEREEVLTPEEEESVNKAVALALSAYKNGIHVGELSHEQFEKQVKEKLGEATDDGEIRMAYHAMKLTGYKTGGRLLKRRDAHKLRKVGKVMHEFKLGKLKTSAGKKVLKYRQAIAIALSEAGLSRKKQAA